MISCLTSQVFWFGHVWTILTEHQWITQTTVQQKSVVFYDPIKKALEDRNTNTCLSACKLLNEFLSRANVVFTATRQWWGAKQWWGAARSAHVVTWGIAVKLLQMQHFKMPLIGLLGGSLVTWSFSCFHQLAKTSCGLQFLQASARLWFGDVSKLVTHTNKWTSPRGNINSELS